QQTSAGRMKQIDETDSHQAQVGQRTAANQLVADQPEILELVETAPFGQCAQTTAHRRAEVEVPVIDVFRRSLEEAVMRLAIGLNQSLHDKTALFYVVVSLSIAWAPALTKTRLRPLFLAR